MSPGITHLQSFRLGEIRKGLTVCECSHESKSLKPKANSLVQQLTHNSSCSGVGWVGHPEEKFYKEVIFDQYSFSRGRKSWHLQILKGCVQRKGLEPTHYK